MSISKLDGGTFLGSLCWFQNIYGFCSGPSLLPDNLPFRIRLGLNLTFVLRSFESREDEMVCDPSFFDFDIPPTRRLRLNGVIGTVVESFPKIIVVDLRVILLNFCQIKRVRLWVSLPI